MVAMGDARRFVDLHEDNEHRLMSSYYLDKFCVSIDRLKTAKQVRRLKDTVFHITLPNENSINVTHYIING
jgi:hypothetical protein